jgi:CheY-like chemotaxis protein
MSVVLVVDDEPIIRDVVRDVLIDEGYDVVIASDGLESIALLEEVRPDVVVMDVMMPGLDGRQAYLAIRARPELAHVPIIMMSAAIPKDALDDGVTAYLPKPFDLEELIAVVKRALSGK